MTEHAGPAPAGAEPAAAKRTPRTGVWTRAPEE